MILHSKKKIELIIEKPALKRACRILEDAGVKGYTCFKAQGGYGNRNRWERGTDLSASRDMMLIISITDEKTCQKAVESLGALVGAHIGLLDISDTMVIRDDKF